MELRPYQENIINSLRDKLKSNKRVLVYAPTGAGKTKISQFIIERLISKGKNVLFVVPRIKLAEQTQKSFGFGNLILGDKTIDKKSLCTIASLQSLYSRKVNEKYDLIFIDECHFAHNSEYQNYIFNTYLNTKIVGLSATPIDENGYLLFGYDEIVKEVSVKDLIQQGFLCDVEVYTSSVQPKTQSISVNNGDYNMTEASEIVREDTILSNALQEWQKLASGKKTLVFACDILHAEKLKKEFIKIGIKADCVHSKMYQEAIDSIYHSFDVDELQVLINVDMATFGFDQPDIECLLFVRPIKSLRLYKQMVGRGLRTYKTKDKCLVLDCANVIFDNGFPTDDIPFIKKAVINKTVDKLVNIEREVSGEIKTESASIERIDYLKKVGSLVDLYKDKVYDKEQDLVEDCKTLLKRVGYYFWRQNSGKMFNGKQWVHFTDKNGLPDITLIYKSVYIGLELKLPHGYLTKHQKETLPEFIENKTHFFIIENVIDLFESLEKIQDNIIEKNGNVLIKKELFYLSDNQIKYRKKYKLWN